MSISPQLELREIDVFYGASQILFGVSIAIEKGATMALLGRNGAGKSTTFKAIAGLVVPSAGHIFLNTKSIIGLPPYRIARAGISYVPEDRQVFPEHTVEDNLQIARKPGLHGQLYWDLRRIYEVFPVLSSIRHRAAGRLSGGEQQMLVIARALMGNPEIMLLDEPSEGLAPIMVEQIAQLLRRLREMGVTILLAEQNLHFCRMVATHATIIDKGQIVFRDKAEYLERDTQVAKRYLAI
jgi:branched-chain amino acid transport system ATP-binding protein